MSKVAIIMGSASDWDVMSPACTTLEEFGISYDKKVLYDRKKTGINRKTKRTDVSNSMLFVPLKISNLKK